VIFCLRGGRIGRGVCTPLRRPVCEENLTLLIPLSNGYIFVIGLFLFERGRNRKRG
jgi:hypothetical protein